MKQKEKVQQLNKNAGFSLLELLIAVTILAIITIPMLHMFVTSAKINGKSRITLRATVLAQDIAANDETPISEETVASYVSALRKIFVVEDMPAWNPNLRSKTAIRSSDTRYYIDPSIAAAALGIGPNDLINDLKTFGFLFETLCIRDLR